MNDINDISKEVLTKSIREIISNADLTKMTAKLVRTELKTKLNVDDLDSRKKEIGSIIDVVISDLSKAKNNKSEEKKPKIKAEPKTVDKKSDSSDSSSDADGDSDVDDERLARKLHNEELNAKRRAAKKVTKASTKKKAKNGSDNSDGAKTKSKKGGQGYTKPCQLSPELAQFVGAEEMPRHQVVKHMWEYVRHNELFDPKNKQFVICDEHMSKILGRKKIRMFGIMKHLSKHFIK